MRGLERGEADPLGSADTHGEQHLTLCDGLNRVRHTRLQDERLATAYPMPYSTCLDGQFAPKAVNHHVARGSMLWQAPAWLECEQQQPERPLMNQPCLPMATLGRVRFGAQGAGEIWEIERNHRSGQPSARMRPQPLVWLIHVCLQKFE
jgi:hypothetical protein